MIDDEELPDIIDIIDDFDDEDAKDLDKHLKKLQKFIDENHVTLKSYVKEKNKLVKDLKKTMNALDMLILSKAYLRGATYSSFVINHEKLRRNLLKALLSKMDVDAQIIILMDILRVISGDTEPVEHYIT